MRMHASSHKRCTRAVCCVRIRTGGNPVCDLDAAVHSNSAHARARAREWRELDNSARVLCSKLDGSTALVLVSRVSVFLLLFRGRSMGF